MNILKKTRFQKHIGLSIIFLFLTTVLPASAPVRFTTDTVITLTGENFVGGWSYTVEGAPAGYDKGLLVIVEQGATYNVQVQIGGSTLLGDNVAVNGSSISFELMVEGQKVSVNLTVEGDTITGESTSSEGSYSIKGEKTLSME